ncbi:MAG: adenylate kinase [Chitinophagales bacterium]|nr:adenylate kinase [Chitinophagales bacterium]
MLNLILFGPPGSGKGTQATMLKERYDLLHISTGDIFRNELKNHTALGLEVQQYMEAGQLVPDDLTIRILADFTEKNSTSKGIIFDGFPRTIAQADALDAFLSSKNTPVSLVLALQVNDNELIKRILLRGSFSGRSDDQDQSVVTKRLAVYNNQTAPLIDYYKKQNKLRALNGEGSIEEIFSSLCNQIDPISNRSVYQ